MHRSAEEVELDPERAVSAADLAPALFRLALPASRAALAKAFLRFLRVPVPLRRSFPSRRVFPCLWWRLSLQYE